MGEEGRIVCDVKTKVLVGEGLVQSTATSIYRLRLSSIIYAIHELTRVELDS